MAILAWGILRVGQASWQVAWAHRRLLPNRSLRWFWKSIGLPAAIGSGVCLLAQQWLSPEPGIVGLLAVWLLAVLACSLAAADVRETIALRFGSSVHSEPRLSFVIGQANSGGGE